MPVDQAASVDSEEHDGNGSEEKQKKTTDVKDPEPPKQLDAEKSSASESLETQGEAEGEEHTTATLNEKDINTKPLTESDVVSQKYQPSESSDKQVVVGLEVEGGLTVSKSEDELASCSSSSNKEAENNF